MKWFLFLLILLVMGLGGPTWAGIAPAQAQPAVFQLDQAAAIVPVDAGGSLYIGPDAGPYYYYQPYGYYPKPYGDGYYHSPGYRYYYIQPPNTYYYVYPYGGHYGGWRNYNWRWHAGHDFDDWYHHGGHGHEAHGHHHHD